MFKITKISFNYNVSNNYYNYIYYNCIHYKDTDIFDKLNPLMK